MNHGLAQIFGGGHAPLLAGSNAMSDTVVFDQARVVNRDIGGTLFEVRHRIPTGSHYFVNEQVSIGHSAARIVNEARLDGDPARGKGGLLLRLERVNVQAVATFGAKFQDRFALSLLAFFFDDTVVLGTKSLAENFGTSLS
jgi:hypothetical protein